MFKMLNNLWAMFSTLFSAGNKLASALDHSAAFVEGEAAAFNERAELSRARDLKKLRSKYTVEEQQDAINETLARRNLDKVLADKAVAAADAA